MIRLRGFCGSLPEGVMSWVLAIALLGAPGVGARAEGFAP